MADVDLDISYQNVDKVDEKSSLQSVVSGRRTFDGLLIHHIGQFGRFQWFLFLSLSMVALAATWHNLIHVFTGAVSKARCVSDDTPTGDIASYRDLDDALTTLTTTKPSPDWSLRLTDNGPTSSPVESDQLVSYVNFSVSAQEECYISKHNSELNSSLSYPANQRCKQWVYDQSQYKSSIVSEWDLVCQRKWLASFAQSLHMAGCLTGSLVFGILSDRFGRRPTLLITTIIEVVVGILTAFVPWFELYAICRFVVGMAVAGQFNCAYIIAIELVGPKWRGIAGIMMMYLSAVGIILMSGLAYLVRNWRHLQLVISAPLALLLTYILVAPESPRWLLVHKKMKLSKSLITKLAKYNGKRLPQDYVSWLNSECESHTEEGRRYSAVDIFKYPQTRHRTIMLICLWFIISVTYFGLSMYTSNLGGNDYLNFFLSGVVELPAYTFSIWCLRRFGRRIPLGSSMILSGLFLVLTSPFGDDMHLVRIILSMCGKMFISVAFVIIYPFSAEIFPTVIRSNGLGITSMGARIGGFIAPYILLLGEFSTVVPLVVCGGFAFSGGIIVLFLPETHNHPLPETIEDAENMPNCTLRSIFKCCMKPRKSLDNGEKMDTSLEEC